MPTPMRESLCHLVRIDFKHLRDDNAWYLPLGFFIDILRTIIGKRHLTILLPSQTYKKWPLDKFIFQGQFSR